jgi:hypothetical protein
MRSDDQVREPCCRGVHALQQRVVCASASSACFMQRIVHAAVLKPCTYVGNQNNSSSLICCDGSWQGASCSMHVTPAAA